MIRTKQLSPVEAMRALLDRIDALEPKVNAFAYLAADAGDGRGARGRSGADGRRAHRPAARRAGHHQGPGDHQGHADAERQPDLRKGNQPAEDTPVVPRLQDEGAIILGKTTTSEFGWTGVSPLPADRHHAQSVEARLQRRRVLGRRRRRGGGGLRAAAPGQRRRRIDPHAGAFLRRVRAEAELRPRAVLSRSAPATTPRTSDR